MLSKEYLSEKCSYSVYSSESNNGGVIGYTENPEFICSEEKPVYIIFGDHTRNLNIAKKSFSVLDNVKVLLPKYHSDRVLLFIISVWQKQIPNLGYARHWKVAKDCTLLLPIKNGQINLDFMENFVAELEARRSAELEAYLSVAGLKDYTLTTEEMRALAALENREITFIEYKVVDLFTVKNTNNILSRDITPNSGNTPYLSASRENNAVSSYISHRENLIDKGNCIFIGGKTFVVTYQAEDFYSNDSHNLCLYLKEKEEASKLNQLCIISCIERNLGHKYSWGDSISNKKIQTDTVFLPSKNGKPDYAYMQTLISAVQKQVIEDVVRYADEKIAATKTVTAR